MLKGGKLIYHMDRVIAETGRPFGDEAHIIYVNGSYCDESPLGKLMQDFRCKNPDDMYYKLLADQTRYYKESEEGEKVMCKIMEELLVNDRREIALDLLRKGKLTKEDVMESFGFSPEEANELEKETESVPG